MIDILKKEREYTIRFYYLRDKQEKVLTYSVVAKSQNQARFFLGKYLNARFTESLKDARVMDKIYDEEIGVITSIYSSPLTNHDIKLGEII